MRTVGHYSKMKAARFLTAAVALAALAAVPFQTRAPRAASAAFEEEAVLIDFSHAGYGGGGAGLPSVPGALRLRPTGGDDTASIQAALDRVSSMPADARGLRGGVLLGPGRFRVAGRLRLRASGVVLRGRGAGETTVLATGRSRRTLVEVGGDEPPADIRGALVRPAHRRDAPARRAAVLGEGGGRQKADGRGLASAPDGER